MRVTWRAWFLAVFLTQICLSWMVLEMLRADPGSWGGRQERLINVADNRLTVKLQRVPLEAVLEEIGRRAGVEMSIPETFTTPISAEFRDLSLEEGLRR